MVRTDPPGGTVNYSRHGTLTFTFSEWIDPGRAEECITIFPPPDQGIRVRVRDRRVLVSPHEAFAESTTYLVEVGSSLKDLHGVPVAVPFHLCFATGASLDSGEVYGCIVESTRSGEQRPAPPRVALYEYEHDSLLDASLLADPTYMIQTDTVGAFTLSHVRRATYLITGFVDKDRNGRLTPGEKAYAPLDRIVRIDSTTGPIVLYPALSDTAAGRTQSLVAVSPVILLGEWSDDSLPDISTVLSDTGAVWTIHALDTSVLSPRITNCITVRGSRQFVLYLADSLATASYELVYTPNCYVHQPDTLGDDTSAVLPAQDTLRFNGTHLPDTTRPLLLRAGPTRMTVLDANVRFFWSEPVLAAVHTCYLADSLGDTVSLSVDTALTAATCLAPTRKLLPGRLYRLDMPAACFADLSGNPARLVSSDTASTDADQGPVPLLDTIHLSFTTIAADDLCISLSGRAPGLPADSLRLWQFYAARTPAPFVSVDSSGHFRFDSIPASLGTISYYTDRNRDGAHTPGRIFPWRPPEPFFDSPDTVEARARWDIDGITVDVHHPCPSPIMEP